jgi:hypothetical protein
MAATQISKRSSPLPVQYDQLLYQYARKE